MKRLIIAAGLGLLVTGCASEQTQTPGPEFVKSATQLADIYQANLQAELSAAMKQVGPVGAIGVCQSVAPAIASDLSSKGDLAVIRIARRNRNPDNAVPAELNTLYQQLEREPLHDGKPRVVTATIGEREIFMRALPMKDQPCSQCHGTSIAPEVRAAIAASYPNDRAIGFAAGDLRGAMLVTQPVRSAALVEAADASQALAAAQAYDNVNHKARVGTKLELDLLDAAEREAAAAAVNQAKAQSNRIVAAYLKGPAQ